MNFFMYSRCGEGAGLLKRIQEEGNNCSIFIEDPNYANIYDGILPKTDYPEEGDIIIFDSSGAGTKADHFRSEGFKVFGASKFHDKLEGDRDFGLNFMKDHGIMVPESETFNKFNDAYDFAKQNRKKRFVFKPSGKNIPCKLTYCASDYEDLMLYLKYVEENFAKDIDDFVLQEFIEGALVSTEYWVGKNGFVEPVNNTIELKKLMNDDLGPSTGCSANIVWVGDDDSSLACNLKLIEEDLMKEGYIGPIDLNAIVCEDEVCGLEWTPRFGLDAMPTLIQLLNQDLSQLISDLISGTTKEMYLNNCFAGGVRITIPPYPTEREGLDKSLQKISPNIGIPIRGFEDCEENCYFFEVMRKDDLLVHSAGIGVIACVSDLGETPEECFEYSYEILENVKIPDKQYRTDCGKVLAKMHEELEEALNGVRY